MKEPAASPPVTAHPESRAAPRSSWAVAAGWTLTLLAAHALLVRSAFVLRDPDSSLYEWIARWLAGRPLSEWIAPIWQPDRPKSGLFQEHLAVFFWPGAALERLGIPRGTLLANLACWLGVLRLVFAIARRWVDREAAWTAVFLYALSPLAIQYLPRANHENAWALLTAAALLCFLRRSEGARFVAGFAACAAGAVAIKGVLGLLVFVPVMIALVRDRSPAALGSALAGLGAVALAALWYEHAYAARTGTSFFAAYIGAQLAYIRKTEQAGLLMKALNLPYYAASVLYFALPGSLVWLARWSGARRAEPLRSGTAVAVGGAAWVIAISVMTRRAVRYAFPIFPWLSIPAAEAALQRWPRLRRLLADRAPALPWCLMALTLAFTLGAVALNRLPPRHVDLLKW